MLSRLAASQSTSTAQTRANTTACFSSVAGSATHKRQKSKLIFENSYLTNQNWNYQQPQFGSNIDDTTRLTLDEIASTLSPSIATRAVDTNGSINEHLKSAAPKIVQQQFLPKQMDMSTPVRRATKPMTPMSGQSSPRVVNIVCPSTHSKTRGTRKAKTSA